MKNFKLLFVSLLVLFLSCNKEEQLATLQLEDTTQSNIESSSSISYYTIDEGLDLTQEQIDKMSNDNLAILALERTKTQVFDTEAIRDMEASLSGSNSCEETVSWTYYWNCGACQSPSLSSCRMELFLGHYRHTQWSRMMEDGTCRTSVKIELIGCGNLCGYGGWVC